MGKAIMTACCMAGGAFLFFVAIVMLGMVVQGPTAWAWNLALTLTALAAVGIFFLPIAINELEKF